MERFILTPPLLVLFPLFKHRHLLRVVHEEKCAGIDATLIGSNVFAIVVIAYHITILFVADRLGAISIGVFLARGDEHAASNRIYADSAGRIDLCTIDEFRLLIRFKIDHRVGVLFIPTFIVE